MPEHSATSCAAALNCVSTQPPGDLPWTLAVAANDEQLLHECLLASPAIGANCRILVERGARSAAQAYNKVLDRASTDLVVFAHQDVYLPARWMRKIVTAIEALEAHGRLWGVLGVFGVTAASPAELTGYCYSTGLRRILGKPWASLRPARTLDELVLVMRRSSGLRFDERLPGFHLYGADVCLLANAMGRENFIVPAFCIHNANGVVRLPAAFWQAYLYLRRKWWNELPVSTCCTSVTRSCAPMFQRLLTETHQRFRPPLAGRRSRHVDTLYENLRREHPEIETDPVVASAAVGNGSRREQGSR